MGAHGQAQIEYRSLETATREPEVFKTQQVAALAAGKQNKMWNYIETFYHEQGEEDSGYVTEKYLQGIASQVPGSNLTQWSDRPQRPATGRTGDTTDAQAASNVGFTGHALVPDRPLRGCDEEARIQQPEDPAFINEADRKSASKRRSR